MDCIISSNSPSVVRVSLFVTGSAAGALGRAVGASGPVAGAFCSAAGVSRSGDKGSFVSLVLDLDCVGLATSATPDDEGTGSDDTGMGLLLQCLRRYVDFSGILYTGSSFGGVGGIHSYGKSGSTDCLTFGNPNSI